MHFYQSKTGFWFEKNLSFSNFQKKVRVCLCHTPTVIVTLQPSHAARGASPARCAHTKPWFSFKSHTIIGARGEQMNMFGHDDPPVELEWMPRSCPCHRVHEEICNLRIRQQVQPVLTRKRNEPDPTRNLPPLHPLAMFVFRTHRKP